MNTKKENRRIKTLLSVLLALVMVFGVCPFSGLIGSAEENDVAEPPFNRTEPNVTGSYWEFFEDGEIWFTGSEIKAITDDKSPWIDAENSDEDISDRITSIIVADSVKAIGKNAFKFLKPAVIYIPASVTTIDKEAFSDSQIKDIYYGGKQDSEPNPLKGKVPAGIVVHYQHTHTGEVIKRAFAATCTKDGYTGDKYCSLCGFLYQAGEADTERAPHEWSTEYAYITEPTCCEGGVRAKFCVNCGTFDYDTKEPVSATGEHNWIFPEEKLDDCAKHEDEHIVMRCSNKGCTALTSDPEYQELTYQYYESEDSEETIDSKETDFDKLTDEQKVLVANYDTVQKNQALQESTLVTADHSGHFVYDTVEPTCTENGSVHVSCAFCQAYMGENTLPAKGHSDVALGEVHRYSVPATCSDDGEKIIACTVCGDILSSEVIPNNHTEGYRSGKWVTDTEPDCQNPGVRYFWCSYCENYITEMKDGKVVLVQEEIPPTPNAHTPSRWFITQAPTCTENGEQIKICTVKNCPYNTDSALGNTARKISNREVLDILIAVTEDTDKTHYNYKNSGLAESKQFTDVVNEINLAILSAYKTASFPEKLEDTSALKESLKEIFRNAVDNHGFETTEDGAENFKKDGGYKDKTGNYIAYVGEAEDNSERFVFSEIVDRAVDLLIEKSSVINTAEDVVAILEDVWTTLGTEEMAEAVAASENADAIAKITENALAKEELEATGHDFKKCSRYVMEDNRYIPVGQKLGQEGETDPWYEIKKYNAEGEPIFGDAVEGTPNPKVTCVDGGGYQISQCRREGCGQVSDPVLIQKGPHSYETTPHAATCYERGYDESVCTLCGDTTIKPTTPQLSHDYTVEVTVRESTCSKTGVKVMTCKNCGRVDMASYRPLELLQHTDTPVYEAPTCTESGKEGNVCSVCGRFEGKTLKALGHDYKQEVIAPNCTEMGYTVSTCTRCSEQKAPENFVPAAGHQFGKAIPVDATCEKGSYTYEKCAVCGLEKTYNQLNNALGHQIVRIAAKAPTCTEDGCTESIRCLRCDLVEEEGEIIPALGHKPQDVAKRKPTCTEDGNEAYVICTVCGEELEEKVVIPAPGHSYKAVPAVAPTCTEAGREAGEQCERCREYRVMPTPIPAAGHQYGDPVVTKEATAFKSGTKECTCKVCGNVQSETYKLTFVQALWWIVVRIITFPFVVVRRLTGQS